ncbi:MAG: ATP synthase F0 subunit B [Chloroflexi bacterium RBG_16_57_8]|nr:MAG: ATP synthase F0 subunit B [Chloroflexi bacterium RBG_16_57_8]
MEGLKELGWNPANLLAQVVNFGILFVLLYFFAFKRILKMLDERSNRIKESIEQTELIKDQAARAEEESKRRIEAGIKEGQDLISRATRAGDEVRQQAQQKAHEEAQALINRARDEIQRERDEAVGALRREFADLTIMAAEKVIDRSLDKKAHRDVIDKVLDEARTLKQG